MKNYKISEMGQKFLAVMKIRKNYKEFNDPSIQNLVDFVKADDKMDKEDVENSLYFSVHNLCHYPRMANEIMEKLFTSGEKNELQRLIEELGREEPSLIANADSEVKKTISECRKGPFPNDYGVEEYKTNIV